MGQVSTNLVFGVFDMLHPGHVYFLNKANSLPGELHICLASDEFVKNIKNKITNFSYVDREKMLKAAFPDSVVHKGDTTVGEWSIFKKIKPNRIILGFDQSDLKDEIIKLGLSNVEIVVLEPFKQDVYKTSLLAK